MQHRLSSPPQHEPRPPNLEATSPKLKLNCPNSPPVAAALGGKGGEKLLEGDTRLLRKIGIRISNLIRFSDGFWLLISRREENRRGRRPASRWRPLPAALRASEARVAARRRRSPRRLHSGHIKRITVSFMELYWNQHISHDCRPLLSATRRLTCCWCYYNQCDLTQLCSTGVPFLSEPE